MYADGDSQKWLLFNAIWICESALNYLLHFMFTSPLPPPVEEISWRTCESNFWEGSSTGIIWSFEYFWGVWRKLAFSKDKIIGLFLMGAWRQSFDLSLGMNFNLPHQFRGGVLMLKGMASCHSTNSRHVLKCFYRKSYRILKMLVMR